MINGLGVDNFLKLVSTLKTLFLFETENYWLKKRV